jgi:hypothetical protein
MTFALPISAAWTLVMHNSATTDAIQGFMLFIKASLRACALQFMDCIAVSPLRWNAKIEKYARMQNLATEYLQLTDLNKYYRPA